MNFELKLKELEDVAMRLEQGALTLEEALALYVQGVAALQACQSALQDAEQRVELVLKDIRKPFESGSSS